MSDGYIMIARRLFDHKLWLEKRQLSKCEAWIDLIAQAAFKDHERIIDGSPITIPRGSLLASERYLATRWRWSRNKIRRFLDMLKDDSMATLKCAHNHTLISLCNFDTYNMNGTTLDTTKGPPTIPPAIPLEDQREESKEGKKKGNKGKGTLEEFCAFAVEIGLPDTDGEATFWKWSGNGWMNGKSKILDWRATMRNWKARGFMPSQKPNGCGAARIEQPAWAESDVPQWTIADRVRMTLEGKEEANGTDNF